MNESPARQTVAAKDGSEPLHEDGRQLGRTVLDFWRWSASDLGSAGTGRVLGQFLVGTALGADLDSVRDHGLRFQLVTSEGIRVEVTSTIVVGPGPWRGPSEIGFGLPLAVLLEAASDAVDTTDPSRVKVCVFALLSHGDRATLDPLNAAQWRFWVTGSASLHEYARAGGVTINEKVLGRIAGPPVPYARLAEAVRAAS